MKLGYNPSKLKRFMYSSRLFNHCIRFTATSHPHKNTFDLTVTIYKATHIIHSEIKSSDVSRLSEAGDAYLVHNKITLPRRAQLRLNSLHMKGNLICCVKLTIHWGPILPSVIHMGILGRIEQNSSSRRLNIRFSIQS